MRESVLPGRSGKYEAEKLVLEQQEGVEAEKLFFYNRRVSTDGWNLLLILESPRTSIKARGSGHSTRAGLGATQAVWPRIICFSLSASSVLITLCVVFPICPLPPFSSVLFPSDSVEFDFRRL